MSFGLVAQKSTSKKVKTQFLSIPNYDVSSTDASSLKAYFSTGDSQYGTKKLMDSKTVCVVKGGSLKDAKELTTYYYQHSVTRPASYLFLKDAEGNTIYANQISKSEAAKADFGKEKCEFWMKSSLEKKYEAEKLSWERSDHGAFVNNEKEIASKRLSQNGLVSYVPTEFEVYSAKGKGLDYKSIEEAYDLAYNAYESIAESGLNQKSFDDLGKATVIWEAEVEKANFEDKDARINKKIAQGLYINLSYAHFFRFEMLKAGIAAQKADESFGNFSNNTRAEVQELRMDVNRRKPAVEKNKELISDLNSLHQLAEKSKVINLSLQDFAGSNDEAQTEYIKFSGDQMSSISDAAEEANLAAGGTSYDKYVVPNSVPKTLSIMRLQEELTAFPVEITQIDGLASVSINSNSIESIPEEIGNMESLKKLYLAKNKITTIPESIGNCSKIKVLNLSGNPIETLPESLKNCKDLKNLNLKGTNVSAAHVKEIQNWLPNCKIKI